MTGLCSALRVFVRYAYREGVIARDLSAVIETPRKYRLSNVPRSINWDEVRRMLEGVDRRGAVGKRDYAILLLLVTYGLRAREVAALTLDDIDWERERLLVPERKAGHCTAYPLSSVVGEALLDYLRNARPTTSQRQIFFRVLAPRVPMGWNAISNRATHFLCGGCLVGYRVGVCHRHAPNFGTTMHQVGACVKLVFDSISGSAGARI